MRSTPKQTVWSTLSPRRSKTASTRRWALRRKIVQVKSKPLTELELGEEATVQRVPDDDDELLRYLGRLGLVPGQRVQLIQAEPFGGPLTLRANGREAAISRQLG